MLCLTLGPPLKEAARGQSETVLVNLSTMGTQDLHVPTVSSARHDRRCRLVETEDQGFFASSLQLQQRFLRVCRRPGRLREVFPRRRESQGLSSSSSF